MSENTTDPSPVELRDQCIDFALRSCTFSGANMIISPTPEYIIQVAEKFFQYIQNGKTN